VMLERLEFELSDCLYGWQCYHALFGSFEAVI
jgi:hypothetical protein